MVNVENTVACQNTLQY